MNSLNFPILSVITHLPLLGILVICLIKSSRHDLIRWVAFLTAVVTFLVSLPLYFLFDAKSWQMQFVEHVPWISEFGISYHMGIDGISLLLVLLTTFLSALAILSTWSAVTEGVKGYMVSLLFLEVGMIGVFCSLDFILFYVFWEVMLIPMYFIIGIWGGPRRIYAAVKFFIYTMSGSVLMLVAILVLYFMHYKVTGVYTFDILTYYNLGLPSSIQFWLFLAFFLAFAIKVPMFPFHTWLPDAHVEAPTAGSVILAGVLLKMGTYGFLRFSLPILPKASIDFIPVILFLSVVGIIYGALVSLAQDDIKK
ncbi:MAG TPA: Fe-S-binding domain-containing protein, partial [Syntrophobacteraceae bacterium]|nr:Fe-S-binding domain-containing protein [Syntrophobacteraceae bacterium]